MRKGRLFGEFFQDLRIRQGKTLRKFCADNGFDPGNISKLERGVLPPPQSKDKLAAYAGALGLKEGGDEWYEFFDLAAAEAGTMPADLVRDAGIASRLPVFFRTLRDKKLSGKQLDELIEKIKKA